jgi:curved DNA-binding protein CbpA
MQANTHVIVMASSSFHDHYAYLKLAGPQATSDEITKAFRALALKLHPDKNEGSVKATEDTKFLNSVYDALKTPEKKATYDRIWRDNQLERSTPLTTHNTFTQYGSDSFKYWYKNRYDSPMSNPFAPSQTPRPSTASAKKETGSRNDRGSNTPNTPRSSTSDKPETFESKNIDPATLKDWGYHRQTATIAQFYTSTGTCPCFGFCKANPSHKETYHRCYLCNRCFWNCPTRRCPGRQERVPYGWPLLTGCPCHDTGTMWPLNKHHNCSECLKCAKNDCAFKFQDPSWRKEAEERRKRSQGKQSSKPQPDFYKAPTENAGNACPCSKRPNFNKHEHHCLKCAECDCSFRDQDTARKAEEKKHMCPCAKTFNFGLYAHNCLRCFQCAGNGCPFRQQARAERKAEEKRRQARERELAESPIESSGDRCPCDKRSWTYGHNCQYCGLCSGRPCGKWAKAKSARPVWGQAERQEGKQGDEPADTKINTKENRRPGAQEFEGYTPCGCVPRAIIPDDTHFCPICSRCIVGLCEGPNCVRLHSDRD